MIKIEELGKTYNQGSFEVCALKEVNLEINPGEFVAIIGPSGSGKSTLMNLLGCLDQPTTGDYFLEDVNVKSLDSNQLAEIRNRRIGFVFQSFNLLPRATALENVELPLLYGRIPNSKELALKALEKVGLGERAKHRPNELSGGERQRVAIARAIVNNPAIILADEPTGNLDSANGEEILRIFNDLNAEGVTIILITHEKEIAERTRRIIAMKDGKMVSDMPTNGENEC
jgi:putative ABC transport system ATP-binding protein